MSSTAIALILTAAVAHASWNLFSKQAATTGAAWFVWLLAAGATTAYLPVVLIDALLARPHLTGMNWLFMAGTGVLEAAYFLFLQLGYRLGDLSLVYPVGRGTGAMLAAVAGIVLFGERPSAVSIAGIAAIIAGVVLISLPGRSSSGENAVPETDAVPETAAPETAAPEAGAKASSKAIGFAVVTGIFIASYTLWDKYAVATLHTPPVFQGYAAFPVMMLAFAPIVMRRRDRLGQVWHGFRKQVLGAAVLGPLAYMLVLAALSFTAVSAVAPAREVSVLFGVLLGRRLLGEQGLARRLTAGAAIVAGVIAIAVG